MSPAPALMLPTPEQEQRLASLSAQRAECEARFKLFKPKLDSELIAWEETALTAFARTWANRRNPDVLANVATALEPGSLVHFDFDRDGTNRGPHEVEATTGGKLVLEAGVKGKSATFDATQYIEFSEPQSLPRMKNRRRNKIVEARRQACATTSHWGCGSTALGHILRGPTREVATTARKCVTLGRERYSLRLETLLTGQRRSGLCVQESSLHRSA